MTTETDRELLELAARAEGRTVKYMTVVGNDVRPDEEFIACWNPLTDDGDAFRLAVKLLIDIEFDDDGGGVEVWGDGGGIEALPANGDLLAATRRAIVRAAAEIGRAKP